MDLIIGKLATFLFFRRMSRTYSLGKVILSLTSSFSLLWHSHMLSNSYILISKKDIRKTISPGILCRPLVLLLALGKYFVLKT